jgi:5-methylcytosine-specific restriction endonuclease McrA
MARYSLTHLSNEVLRRELSTAAANEHGATAELIAHIAEFDARKLFLPAAYGSMLTYCMGELGLSEDAAAKRIQVARASRDFPGILEALAEGRIHLTGLRLLVPRLTPENCEELLAAASHKSKDEIERRLAALFPKAGIGAHVEPVQPTPQAATTAEHAPEHCAAPEVVANSESEHAPGHVHDRGRVAPLSAEAFAVQFTRSGQADERFRYLQDLLGHQVSRADIAEVYDRAVKELIKNVERVRFGACSRPRPASTGSSADPRHISNHTKREVWKRDGGQCTYVSESGRRCEVRGEVEFDHKTEVARGGEATVDGLQLRCRGHNQFTAERTFGAGFMQAKREAAKAAAARRKAEREAARAAAAQRRAEREKRAEESRLRPHELEVIPYLRRLGCREDESRIAARCCRDMADASLEARVKRALSWFGARCSRTIKAVRATSALPADGGTVPG